jgi:16S rRNA (guanine527-N7)-methyltransferase
MDAIPSERIEIILLEYGVEPSSALVDRIQVYLRLLLKWNQSISLTAITDPKQIVRFHFGESLFAASVVPIRNGRLADVGSGAGFPGLPLKLLLPDLDLTLIEASAKKATFLSELIRKLKIDHAQVFHGRAEESDKEAAVPPFDFVAARALGHYDDLLKWARSHLVASGKIILWLGDDDAAAISTMPSWSWGAPTRIPGTERRFIMVGTRL